MNSFVSLTVMPLAGVVMEGLMPVAPPALASTTTLAPVTSTTIIPPTTTSTTTSTTLSPPTTLPPATTTTTLSPPTTLPPATTTTVPVTTTLGASTTTTLVVTTSTTKTSTTLCASAVAWHAALRNASTPSACAAAKLAVSGKFVLKAAKCHAKAFKKDESVDPACLGKADRVLYRGFEKADSRGTYCPFTDDVETVEDRLDELLMEVLANLPTGAWPGSPNPSGSRCASIKMTAAAKAIGGQLRCASKAAGLGESVGADCINKAEARLARSFAKAERRGGCGSSNDAEPLAIVATYGTERAMATVETGTILPATPCPTTTTSTSTTTLPGVTTTTLAPPTTIAPTTTTIPGGSTTTTLSPPSTVTPTTTTSTTTTTIPCKCRVTFGDAAIVAGSSAKVRARITNSSTRACDLDWEVTKHNGTPTVNPTPASGTETLAAGASKLLEITMAVPANTSATDAATMLIQVTGEGASCKNPSKICVLPSGETTASNGWAGGGIHKWQQTLLPATANFTGRKVHEKGPRGRDTCWAKGSPIGKFDRITGGAWSVGANNVWGDDFVGWKAAAVNVYRRAGRAPCLSSFLQDMYINCPSPLRAKRYVKGNRLGGTIGRTTVTSTRAGHSQTR